jgi:hypothetical protein
MNVTYCNGWSRSRRRPGEIWTMARAKEAHEAGELYTVVVGDLDRPSSFLDVCLKTGTVGVGFLDSALREYLSYGFDIIKKRELFLTGSTYREFEGSSDKAYRATIYKFAQNGHVDILRLDGGKQQEAETTTDVSGNWEPIPSFGEYESITRRERGGSIRMEPVTVRN